MLTYPGPARARDKPGPSPKSVCLLQTAAHQEDGGAELLHLERQEAVALPQKPDLEGKKNLLIWQLELELERAPARARRPGLNAGPALHKPKAQAQFSIKPDQARYPKVEQKWFFMK